MFCFCVYGSLGRHRTDMNLFIYFACVGQRGLCAFSYQESEGSGENVLIYHCANMCTLLLSFSITATFAVDFELHLVRFVVSKL